MSAIKVSISYMPEEKDLAQKIASSVALLCKKPRIKSAKNKSNELFEHIYIRADLPENCKEKSRNV